MTKVFNRTTEKARRRTLRKNLPNAEVILWSRLKSKQVLGVKFRRQYSVGTYIIDFYSPEIKLAIEVDGDSHFEKNAIEYDKERQSFIENYGIQFLRFTNIDIYKNLHGVLEEIYETIKSKKDN
jgi:very-short-patch-repair endonuclease